MKKVLYLIATVFFLLTPTLSHAESDVIHQGDADVHVQTDTTIGGSGTTHTHIETNVNGEDTTEDSSEPGEINVHVHAHDNQQPIATVSGTVTSSVAGPSAQPTMQERHEKKQFIQSLFEHIKNFLVKLYHSI